MAAQVISDGPHNSVVKQIVCRKCGAVLAYVPLDVRETRHTDMGGDTDTCYWIDCPKCKHSNEVKRPL